jgi:RHS repeat-associated protein
VKVDSILAHYNPGETEALWQDPPTATSVQLHYQVSTAVGPFSVSDLTLEGEIPSYTITRKTYFLGSQAVAQRIVEPVESLAQSDFDDGSAADWTVRSGTWSVVTHGSGYGYQQSSAVDTHSSYMSFPQGDYTVYEWTARFVSGTGRRAGLQLFAANPNAQEYHHGYIVRQYGNVVRIEEVVGTIIYTRASAAAPAANGQTHHYRVTYDRTTGQIDVFRNGAWLLSWTDATPLTSGNLVALRTQSTAAIFDDILIHTSGVQNSLYYIHTDHLGSTSLMSGANGQKVETSVARYLPYGGWRTEPTADLTDRAFTGQKENMDIGLYYYNARYYAPGTGRFISADTLVPDPTNPQAFNKYSYALGNPLRFADPTGHCAGDPGQPGECYESVPTESRRRRINVTALGHATSTVYNLRQGSLGLSQGHYLIQEGFELVPGTTYSGQVIVRGSHAANEAVGLSPYLRHANQSHAGIQALRNPTSAAATSLTSTAARGTALLAVGANILDYQFGDNSEYGIFSTQFAAANTVDLTTGLGFPAIGAAIGSAVLAPGPGTFVGGAIGVFADVLFTFTARDTVVAQVNDVYQQEAARWSLSVDNQLHNNRTFPPSIPPYTPYNIQPTYTNARTLGILSSYHTLP